MKNSFILKCFVMLLFLTQLVTFAQDNKIKIYESNSGNGACLIVFPSDNGPLMVKTGNDECVILKTMAMDDWHEMSSATVVNVDVAGSPALAHAIKSPRDAASGQATGKRQHKPFLLSSLTVDGINPTASDIEIYSFSWGMSNSGSSKTIESAAKATYDVKSNTKARTMAPSSGGCCSNGVCSVTVSVDKKHTKTGHVTLMK